MFDFVIIQILQLEQYIIVSVVLGLILWIIYLFSCLNLNINSRRLSVLGLFFGTNGVLQWAIGALYLRLVLVIWAVVAQVQLQMVHYVLFVAFSLEIALIILFRKGGLSDLLGVGLIVAGLLTSNLLQEFNNTVRYETIIAVTHVTLGIFVCLYMMYVTGKDIGRISKIRRQRDVQIQMD